MHRASNALSLRVASPKDLSWLGYGYWHAVIANPVMRFARE